jgi:hypothetical protein
MPGLHKRLADLAAQRYREADRASYYFALFKLRNDPFYSVLLAEGLVPANARIVDLGCAQGLLAAWLWTAQQSYAAGVWESACPAPVSIASYRGIDRSEAEIHRARQALGANAEFAVGDMAQGDLSGATLIVLLDVLHYLDYTAQRDLLHRVRAALPAEGLVLLRIGDSDGSLRARVSGWVDRLVLRLRGRRDAALSRRPLTEWLALLEEAGFVVHEVARQRSLAYTNCVLRAFPAPR